MAHKIMVVDDSSIVLKMIQGYLKSYNHEVVGTARDGQTALEVFKEMMPDIVTLDITMPRMDGLSVLKEILKINGSAKVIVISALADKATALEALKLGAKSYIPKPFGENTFKQVMDDLIVQKN